ncbi:bromodomain-containing protein DDB_G0270170-like [Anneissia japonica]|uniref:bromodomain-containing protein DDB_G0270170-like n=1 Tax=Anneissia japonica TaxID=1529436 RepID=UPI001425AA13|nr:bromodomain-containing protein DDB_G0270170-like [Anneissia japonica]
MANDTKKGRASLVEIQTWWKVPTIAHFCSLFRAKFGLPDFEIEELEEALVSDTQDDPNDFLKNLLARILFGCYGRKDINSSNYDKYLRDIMKHRWEMEESRVNPLNSEDTTYHSLPTLSKVELLHALCDYRLDAEDVSDLLKGTVGEHMRIEPLGSDSEGAKYWYFYGTRLYKETKKLTKAEKEELRKKREKEKRKKRREKAKERAKEKEKLKKIKLAKKNAGDQALEVDQNDSCTEENSQDTPTTSTTVSSESDSDDDLEPPRWHLVCDTQDDWEILAQKFKKTKSKNEKELYRALADDFLPVMVDLYNQKEKALRKKLLEMAPRRTSGRIQEKMQRRTEEDDYIEGYSDTEGHQEEDKFSCNERRHRNRLQQKELQILEEQEAKRRKEEEEEKAKKAKEDRAKRVQLREERARLIAEGKTIPKELMTIPQAPSVSPTPKPKKPKFSGVRDDEFDSLYISMHKVLDAVKRHSNSWPFLEPVNEEYAPKYLEYIEKPMDLGTMEEKLDKKQYSSKSEFVDDMHLMFENCETYNGSESEYTEMARTLEVVFTKMMLRCFPEDDIDFFDDEFFMSENSEPRKSSRSSRTRKTVEELDKKVFGSFREDTSEESESEDDNYFPSEKKFKGKAKSPKKRPQRMPRVNYAMDGEESSRDDLSRAYALRNFYGNRGMFNADPTYGVTCSHMSVMRVVDGKIVEERGPLMPVTQSASTKDVTQLEDEDEKRKNQVASQSSVAVSKTEGVETKKEDKNGQSVKKDPEVYEDHSSLKNNLSSFLKHPKVRSKTERLKEAEKNSFVVNTPVSLPSTVFTPTTVSKAVPAILSKGNRLKQEMKNIAADGTKQSKLNSKLKTKKADKILSHSSFVSNGPENVQQAKPEQENIHDDKIKVDEVKSKQVSVDEVGKIAQLKTGNTEVPLGSGHSVNTKLLNPIHSIPSTSSISSESLPQSTVTLLPLSTTKQANDFTENDVRSLNSSHSGHQPETSCSELLVEKQEGQQAAAIQDRKSVITFQPNNAPQSEEVGVVAVKNNSNKPQEPGNDHCIEKTIQIKSSNIGYSALQVNSQSSMADIYVAKPVMQPHQKVYVASKPEAQRSIVHEDSDLKDLIDMDTIQDKKSNFPTTSINHILSPEVSRINSFNTSPLMMNRVLLPNSLTINHSGSADTSHSFTQLKGILQNPAPHHLQRSAQPMQHDSRFTPHLSGSIQHSDSIQQHTGDRLQHSDDRLQNPDARLHQTNTRVQQSDTRLQQPDGRLHQPDTRLQHPDSRLQQSDDRLQHPDDRLQLPDAQLQQPDTRLQHHDARLWHMDNRLHHSDARLHQSDTRQQHPEDRTQPHEARLQHPEARLQHPESRLQHPEARLQHPNARLQNHESNRLQHQETSLQYQEASKLQQHHEPKLQHQETRVQHPQAMLHHLEVSQQQRPEASRLHHPEARMQHLDARLQHSEDNRLHQSEVRHPEPRLQHPLSSLHQNQDSIRQSTASMQHAGNRQLSSLQYPPAHLNWNQHQQLYQTQPVFQVGTQPPVGMSQAYQMSVPGHPSLQNGSFPPT